MVRSTPFHAVAVLVALGALASGCGDDRRAAGGFRVITARDATTGNADATESEGRDAGFGGSDVGEGRFDATGEGWPDAEAPWDGGFGGFDVGWPDAGFPEFPDATVPDSGFRRDASVPDTGPRDSGFPPFDAGSGSGDAGPMVQTNVTLLGTSSLVLNLQPPVAADPLTYSTTLQYDNSGPGSQNISVVSAEASIVIISQTFQMGPSHTAPVGQSTRTISKVPGSGSGGDFTLASIACGFPAIVSITLSNGVILSDFATITCVQ